jgi:outer membrane receptor protein involved in Fe transport
LDEVVVSGSRTSEKLSETPMAIGVVGENALKRDKPKTIGDAINQVPGVNWVDLGNEQHMMSIRQPMSTNAVYQYLEDGIPIRPLGVFNHNSLNEMNMAGSGSVEVVKGAASSLYGSNAVGGAVNFLTARPLQTPYFSAGARYDNTNAYRREDLAASNSWGDFGARVSAYSSRRDNNNWQMNSNGAKDSVTARGDYLLSGTSLLHSVITYSNLDSGMVGSVFENDYKARPGFSYNTFTYRRDKTLRANLVWEGETLANGQTTVTLFGRQNDHGQLPSYTINSCTGAGATATCKGTENNNHVSSLGVDVKHQQEFAFMASRLIAGVYLDNSDNPYWSNNLTITRDNASGIYTGYAASAVQAGVRNYHTGINNTALFAQYEISPLEALRVVAGVRNDAISYNFTNNLTPGANYGAPSETRSFSHLSPKLGATYALSKEASVYTNVSQGFTPPEVSALYSIATIPDLKAATYDNYEIGTRIAFLDGALKLDGALYQLDGQDTILSYTIAPGNSVNRNAGSTRSQGVELGLNWTADSFDARLATTIAKHTFVNYQVSAALDYSGKEMPQAPSNVTTAEIGYKPLAHARIALEMVQVGAYWMNNANTVSYDGHRLFNLRGSYSFAGGWEAWLQGRNLTDQLYSDSASSSYSGTGAYTPNTQNTYTVGAPRSLMLGATYTFDGK